MSPNGHQILLLYSEKRKNPYVIGEKRSDAEFVIETTSSSSSSILVEYGLHVIRIEAFGCRAIAHSRPS